MSFTQILTSAFAGLLVVYLAARLISAAFFKSKQQYEQTKGK